VVEVRDIAEGLWLWRQAHPAWRPGLDWEPEVSSFVVETKGEVVLIDPLAPRPSEQAVWSRFEQAPPTAAVWPWSLGLGFDGAVASAVSEPRAADCRHENLPPPDPLPSQGLRSPASASHLM
jgi:hypothetical protein